MINQETIQRIKDAVHIEDVVGEFVTLKKRGANYIACCPFHNEKTPSFVVTPAKNIYKCFGCGKAGDGVRFLMDHEHYTYPEALRYLAKKYNITIEEEELTAEQVERNNERDALFHVSEFAQQYFADLLYNDEMGSAIGLSYFHNRGLTDEIIKRFGLGYCLDAWDNFSLHARQNGYSDTVLEKTGLTIFKEKGKCYDRFRGRVMFPIFSISGRVLGFSGRILTKDKDKAKYVNSPDSDIYNKSHILYGIYQAKSAIAKQDKCYLVEGNVDVVSMHQSGVENTVASCGTSLTVEQIRLIKRYTSNVTVLYDGDSAGIKATLRAVNMLFEEGLHVRTVLFPDGEDPDSYAQKYGSTQLQEYLHSHEENFILYKTQVLLDDVQGDPIRKAEVLKEIVQTIALVPDMLERTEYVSLCAMKLNVPETTLQSELAKTLSNNARRSYDKHKKEETQNQPSSPGDTTDLGIPFATPPFDDFETQEKPPVVPVKTVAPVSLNLFPDEAQEKKIITLLLNDGTKQMERTCLNDAGKAETDTYYVAAVIVGEIADDDISFDNPIYQSIFNLFVENLKQSVLIDGQFFVDHPDEQLRSTALALMVDTYHISDMWKEKHVPVTRPEDCVATDVLYALRTFKLRKLDHKIERNSQQFRFATSDDEKFELVAEKMHFIKLRQQICKALNCVLD